MASLLSCFYYVGSGERCGAPFGAPASSLFCPKHVFEIYRRPVDALLHQAVDGLVRSTRFSNRGSATLACRDFEAWGQLCNSVSGLALRGYKDEQEVLDVLLSGMLSDPAFRRRYRAKVPKKWKLFETLVARLHVQQL